MSTVEVTEKEFTAQVVEIAKMCGWLRYHTFRSSKSPSGFPDEVLVRERVVFAELKRGGGKPTDAQGLWLTRLAAAGAEVYLWYPSDLEEVAIVLGHRWEWRTEAHALVGREIGPKREGFNTPRAVYEPRSVWTREGNRAEKARESL